jgi:tetratricopeptide (TPR) repeat protein
MTNSATGYSLPRSSDEFERLVLKLLRRHWQLPQLERLRDPDRRAKGVHLVEISGRPRLAAVRCDLRETQSPLAAAEIKDAAEQAAGLGLPIGRFVIATTARRSAGLRRMLFDLNRTVRAGALSAIEVLTWDDIEELLDEYPQIVTEFGHGAKRQALTNFDAAVHLDPCCARVEGTPSDPIEAEIADAAAHLDRREYQMARLALLRLREQRWNELANPQKFRVLTHLAVAWRHEGEARKAAMLLIAARSLAPEDEIACTNEALAHELLGERERAFALADRLRMQFPSSARALALWLNNSPLDRTAAELESEMASEHGADPEVAIVMARRALSAADYVRGERYARAASAALPNQSEPWLLLGQAVLLAEVTDAPPAAATEAPVAQEDGGGDAAGPSSLADEENARAREAESCFTQALTLAQNEGYERNEVQAMIGRAQARIALRDTEGAGRDIEEAHGLEREDGNGLSEYGIVLRSRGSLSEAIDVFRRAAKAGGRDDAEFHLAVTLRERDEPGDLQEAAELLSRAVARVESVPKGDYPFAVACAVDTLARLERWHDADAVLAAIPAGAIVPVAMLTLRANLRLAQGKFDQAVQHAEQALAALAPETAADDRRKLAALLHELGRYRDALPLWEALAQSGSATDSRRVLDCATRLGRDDIVRELSLRLAPESAATEPSQSSELERLERNDPEAALGVLQQYLGEHSDDPVMRLRRSIVADRLGRAELVVADPNAMPPAAAVAPALGREAVRIMREGGRANEALSYAYELIRRRGSDPDAHRAYLAALGPIGPMPHVPEFDTAAPGAAVCFVEQDANTERWVLLEDAADPDEAQEEYGPSHPLTKALKGRRVGDKFQLPEGRFSRKSGVIKQIISKYAWRYQDCLGGWQKRFPGLPELEMTHGRPEAIAWSEMPDDFADLFPAASGKRDDMVKEAGRVYAGKPIPIHAVAEQLGLNDLQTIFLLAQRPDVPLKCCIGTAEELEEALGAFERANAVVIDLTAIATLCLLGRLSLLATWPRQFVISQSTLTELRRLAMDDSLLRLPAGFSASINGSGNEGKRADVQLRALADALQSVCRVRDSSVTASIEPDRRERLVRTLGRHGAESVVLASMPGHVLWSDDRILARLAKAEFGVRRVWTEAALQARVQAGCLDPAELATASTKLAGWGYTFTTPSVETLMRAGSVAMWNPDQFPLRQALDQFATESIALSDVVRLAAELIVKMYSDVYLRGTRRTVTMRLLDRIAQRQGGSDAIEALPRSLPVRFGLDLIRARELSDVIRGWMAHHTVEQEREQRDGAALSA